MSADRMILGQGTNAVFSMDSQETGLNSNVIVAASSGCGKTLSIMEPRLIETHHSSLIVTVSKRRIVEKYTDMFRSRGYEVLDLNFVQPEKSTIAYDPMEYIKDSGDITFLASALVKSNPRKACTTADPFWDDISISLLSALIALVQKDIFKPTFADVLELNDLLTIKEDGDCISTSLDSRFDELARRDPHSFAVTSWNSFKNLPIKTANCVYGTLNTTLDKIFTPQLRRMIADKKKIAFERLASRKTVLFVSTSAVNPSLSAYVNIFYAQMFKQLFEYAESLPEGRLPIPVGVLCDDFAVGSRIQNFPEYISIFREKQISVTILLQSESQLESMYGSEDAVTIIDNCDSYVYMGGMNLKTCRSISERLNIPLEDVLYMPLGQEIIFRRGQRPIITQRYDIFSNSEYQRITQAYEEKMHRMKQEASDKPRTTRVSFGVKADHDADSAERLADYLKLKEQISA